MRIGRIAGFTFLLTLLTLARVDQCLAEESLPWEKDYTTALAKAKAAHRPVFLMLTATWCGPCKMLERQTLPSDLVRSGLKDFVWVKAYEDKKLNQQFGLNGYPTLVFLDSANEKVLEKTTGYEEPQPFLRHVIAARKAGRLPLTPEMQSFLVKTFDVDENLVLSLIDKGDVDALVKYLTLAKEDDLRFVNYLVARVHLPPGVDRDEVLINAGDEQPLRASGLFMSFLPRDAKGIDVRIIAPGCKTIEQSVPIEKDASVAKANFVLERLSDKDSASFSGRVLRPDGQPVAQAIVRICDWGVTHADDEGRFHFSKVSPGKFTVRGEAPGGEFQQDLTFKTHQELIQDLTLNPVTTVGIRWALQSREGSTELAGSGVRTGVAYFSVEHGRFLLSRGAEVREYHGSDFMLKADWNDLRQYLKPGQIEALAKTTPGTPIFWLFDAGPHANGLHLETKPFDAIEAVNGGQPTDEKYFEFLRGEPVRKGQVYTVRCTFKDCYAKMEITDVTLVSSPAENNKP